MVVDHIDHRHVGGDVDGDDLGEVGQADREPAVAQDGRRPSSGSHLSRLRLWPTNSLEMEHVPELRLSASTMPLR
jgi:hypothetical protein